jgi:hypothetical protein
VVSGHHLLVIFSFLKPLYNGKFILKITLEVISEDQYFSQLNCTKNAEVLHVLENILISLIN